MTSFAGLRAGLSAGFLAALVLVIAAAPVPAQESAREGERVRAPLPPQRPFDLDLEGTPKLPDIVVPPAAPIAPPLPRSAAQNSPQDTPAAVPSMETPRTDTASATPPVDGTPSADGGPDDDEGVEWPKLTPGQKAGAEPEFDPNEKPERPGISTDPGTSVACLPGLLRQALAKIADRYGAVKVTSTWRPPWRARRGSYHKRCEALDFRVPGVRPRAVLEWVRSLPEVGGHHVYWNGLIHIDIGPRRPW